MGMAAALTGIGDRERGERGERGEGTETTVKELLTDHQRGWGRNNTYTHTHTHFYSLLQFGSKSGRRERE
jgi:hypothetical protein